MVTLHYTITKEDYVTFYTYMYWDEVSKKKKRLNNLLKQVAIFSIVLLIIYLSNLFNYIVKISIPIFILLFSTSLLPLFTAKSQLINQAEKITDEPDNVSIFNEIFLDANETMLVIKSNFIETKYDWKAIVKKTETNNFYYLFQNSMQAIIIPKRAFTKNEDKAAFDKILSRNLSLDAELKDANIK